MSRNFIQRAAVVMLALEALGLLMLTGWQVVLLAQGELASLATSLALIVMSLVATALVAAFSYAVATGVSWGRSGGIVTQVLIFAVAIGSVQGENAHWGIAAALAIPAVATFAALIATAKPSSAAPSDR